MKIPLYLQTYFSPFKRPKLHFYFGKVAKPVPYFLPRKWVKYTNQDTIEAATQAINNPILIKKSFEEWYEYYKNHSKAVPLKIGFSHCGLGWKTKYGEYRFEWSPRSSFIAFGYQIAITLVAPHCVPYWESFLYYHYDTNKSKSKKERIKQCIKEYPQIWTRWRSGDKEETTDYYQLILKNKYK